MTGPAEEGGKDIAGEVLEGIDFADLSPLLRAILTIKMSPLALSGVSHAERHCGAWKDPHWYLTTSPMVTFFRLAPDRFEFNFRGPDVPCSAPTSFLTAITITSTAANGTARLADLTPEAKQSTLAESVALRTWWRESTPGR
ncbi:hypothetical protein S40288_11152 [Stachybotrys chartarum IBT 40288]|nr:hypothetical protein S40288_11152 [Stachybotrys chartarum IBT 40288]